MELIEREHQLAALRAAAARAPLGKGGTVLVYGEAGIGKSSLVRAAFGEAEEATGLRMLWGGCEALFSPRPLGPLYDVASQLGERVRRALGRPDERSELFDLVLDELRGSRQPMVLVFDDMHWADAATLDLAKFLARRINSAPALLVLTFRDDEVGEDHPLRAVLGDLPSQSVTRVPLAPLTEQGVAELMRRSGVRRDGLHAATRGNPFFVTESLRSDGIPPTVRDAVLARASRQAPAVRVLLDLAAIVPGRVEMDLVERMLAPTAEDIAAAVSSGLLVMDRRHLAFRHELARLAVEQSITGPRAAGLHARMLSQLEADPQNAVPLARLVHHAAGAGDVPAVLRLAPLAAEQAASHGSHREAASLYAAAVEHSAGLAAEERAALLEHQAFQCYLIEQEHLAIEARQQALAISRGLGDKARQGRNLRWLSRLHWLRGHTALAVELADQAIALLEGTGAAVELAWAHSNRAQLHMLTGNREQAIALGTQAVDVARQAGDNELSSHALNNVGAATYPGNHALGRELLEQSLHLAVDGGYSEHVARAYTNLLCFTVLGRDYVTARRYVSHAKNYYLPRHLDIWTSYHTAWESRIELEQCRFDNAQRLSSQLLARPSTSPISRMVALVVLARLQMRRGQPEAGQTLREATTLAQSAGELLRLGWVAVAHAEAAWLGLPEADPALLREVFAKAIAQDDARVAGELALWLQLSGAPVGGAAAVAEPGAREHLAGQWREAAAIWAAAGCGVEQALALLSSGDADAMRQALSQISAMGLATLTERFRAHLRGLGVKGIARGPRATTATSPAGLTQREGEVLELLVQGLTDAEIAARLVRSEKTVHHHVSAILAKLQARSRTEASAIAVARQLTGRERWS